KDLRREQRALLIGAEEADGIDVSAASVAADMPEEILAAHAVRQMHGCKACGATQGSRTVAIERDDAWMGKVAVVAAEQLVATVPRQHDRHVPPRHLRHVPRRDGGGVGERLVEVPDQAIEDGECIWTHDQLVMLRAEVTRDCPCVCELVERRLVETD